MEWDRAEVEATVADYFHMLILELSQQGMHDFAHHKLELGRQVLVGGMRGMMKRLAGALGLKYEYPKRIQCGFLRRNRGLQLLRDVHHAAALNGGAVNEHATPNNILNKHSLLQNLSLSMWPPAKPGAT